MHLFITGPARCGKTTLIRRVSRYLKSKRGFYTSQILRKGNRQGFKLCSFSGKSILFASKSKKMKSRYKSYYLDIAGFEDFLKREFSSLGARFLIVDEIGKMELYSPYFKDLIRRALGEDEPRFLGTVGLGCLEYVEPALKEKRGYLLDLRKKSFEESLRFCKRWAYSLTAKEARTLDRASQEVLGVSQNILMENAARHIALEAKTLYRKYKKKIVIFCGSGNNGADGLCCARHLYSLGIKEVYCVLLKNKRQSALNQFQEDILRKIKNSSITEIFSRSDLGRLNFKDFIGIDGIFGIGFRGKPTSPFSELIEYINKNSFFTLSIDIPSGLDADKGALQPLIVKSDITVSFFGEKVGFLAQNSLKFLGKVKVRDLGVPLDILWQILWAETS